MEMLAKLNSPTMYLICGTVVLFVAIVSVFFMIRAYRAGLAVGMDKTKMKRTITASATFAILPSVGILLGVIALSGSLGTPLPWLRLSVIGALHYETQVAEAAAEATGLTTLSISQMTPESFVTIALTMSVCIMWGMVFSVFFTKKYSKKLKSKPSDETKSVEAGKAEKKKKLNLSGFGDIAMTAMFIGLVSAYIGSYIGQIKSSGNWLPLAVACVGGLAMAIFLFIKEKKNAEWIDSFSIAGSMIIAMTAAIFLGKLV